MGNQEPFALLITWTCYGTWLPGDARGFVSNIQRPDGSWEPKHNIPGTPVAGGDPARVLQATELQKHDTVLLTPTLALEAARALVRAAADRDWRIVRGAVMANHIHVLVMDCPDDGPLVRRVLKGCSQADLSRSVGEPLRWWTTGGSDRYKKGWEAIEAAVAYVANQQGKWAQIVEMQASATSASG